MYVVHLPHGCGTQESRCRDWLEVRRGRTRFPVRPLNFDRILIGSGTNCHLQLGGGLPMLHTLMTRENDCWRVDAIAPEPQLVVNDVPCRQQDLEIGDSIRIAEFEFILRRSLDGRPKSQKMKPSYRVEADDADWEGAAGLSANELVHRLEQEFDLIESLEHSRNRGATALMRALRHRRAA